MNLISCDPGVYGAFAHHAGESLAIVDMPTIERKVGRSAARKTIDDMAVEEYLRTAQMLGATHLIIEKVHGGPKMSGQAGFAFGYGYAMVLTTARMLGFIVEQVEPATWKAQMRVTADKDVARQRASDLMPQHRHLWPLKKHDGRAEAALIGLWAMKRMGVS